MEGGAKGDGVEGEFPNQKFVYMRGEIYMCESMIDGAENMSL